MGPVLFEPYARDLAARLGGARRVLEIAAGTGRVTRHLLAALPADGELVATDLNEPMIEQARKRIAHDPRLVWQPADAQALPFDAARFDVVACQFGLMFCPDRALALREMRRVLARGGRLLLSTWDSLDRNPASRLLHELAYKTFPTDPPMFMKLPFSMPDPGELRRLVREAGFAKVEVETVAQVGEAASAADLATGLVRGNPLWNQLVERGVDAPAFERAVAQALASTFGDLPCRSALSAHVVTAIA
jgi:ubiquinone/menaquinone biosynthesis C-methylase UbiE